MGCGSSKESEGDDKEIKSDFKEVKIPEFDDFFNKAKETLEAAEEIRSGLEDAPDTLKELPEGWRLKEYKTVESVKVLFWALSQNAGGEIKKTKFESKTESPYFGFDNGNLNVDTVSMAEALQKFLTVAMTAPIKVPELVQKLTEMSTKAAELGAKAPQAAKDAGLGMGALTAAKNAAYNVKLVSKGLAKVQKLPGIVQAAASDAKDIIPKLKEFYDKADEVGAKGKGNSCMYPKQILKDYHPGPLKTEAEIAAEEAAKAKEKDGKKDKKKKKDDKKKDDKKKDDKKKEEKKEEKK